MSSPVSASSMSMYPNLSPDGLPTANPVNPASSIYPSLPAIDSESTSTPISYPSLSPRGAPTASPVSNPPKNDKVKLTILDGAFSFIYSFFAKVNPLKPFVAFPANICAQMKLNSIVREKTIGINKHLGFTARTAATLACQSIFKKIVYNNLNMFTSQAGNSLYITLSVLPVAYDAYKTYGKR